MIVIILFLFGLIFGSFINALVWRVHKQSKLKNKKAKQKYSLTKGRSQCINCQHQLNALDLIPIASWVYLRGKCRYCKQPISVQYPLVEFVTGSLFVVSYLAWPTQMTQLLQSPTIIIAFLAWLITLILIVALSVYDLKWMLLPNNLVVLLTISSLVFASMRALYNNDVSALVSSVISGAVFFCLFYLLFMVSNGRWIGGGDVKLAIALGFMVGGVAEVLLTIFLASVIGTIYVMPKLLTGKVTTKTRIPFGPLLMLASIAVVFFGKPIISWYFNGLL